jgi:toxin ParE1/3/4
VAKRSPSYQFTDKAERDLEGIIDYTVQEWGVSQANTYLDGLETRAQLLAENPDIGTARETLFEGLLSFPLRKPYSVLQKTGSRHRDYTSTPSVHGSGEVSLIL